MRKLDKEKLKEYYFIEIESNNLDINGWRAFDMLNRSVESPLSMKTDENAWPVEFSILILPFNDEKSIILVSPECPEAYFLMKDEILDKIKEVIYNGLTQDDLLEAIRRYEKINNWNNDYLSNKTSAANPSPWSNITFSTTTSSISDLMNSATGVYNTGDIVYSTADSGLYMYKNNNFLKIGGELN